MMKKTLIISLAVTFVVVLTPYGTVFATVGGDRYVDRLSYSEIDDNIYYLSHSTSGKGCPPIITKLDTKTKETSSVLNCDESLDILRSKSFDEYTLFVDNFFADKQELSRIHLADNDIGVVGEVVDEYRSGYNRNVANRLRITQGNVEAGSFLVPSCGFGDSFQLDGYLVPSSQEVLFVTSIISQCFETEYKEDHLNLIGPINIGVSTDQGERLDILRSRIRVDKVDPTHATGSIYTSINRDEEDKRLLHEYFLDLARRSEENGELEIAASYYEDVYFVATEKHLYGIYGFEIPEEELRMILDPLYSAASLYNLLGDEWRVAFDLRIIFDSLDDLEERNEYRSRIRNDERFSTIEEVLADREEALLYFLTDEKVDQSQDGSTDESKSEAKRQTSDFITVAVLVVLGLAILVVVRRFSVSRRIGR